MICALTYEITKKFLLDMYVQSFTSQPNKDFKLCFIKYSTSSLNYSHN